MAEVALSIEVRMARWRYLALWCAVRGLAVYSRWMPHVAFSGAELLIDAAPRFIRLRLVRQ